MAVYTPVTETQLKDFLSGYDLPELQSFAGIQQGVENTNYLLTMQDGVRYILTLFEKRTNPADLPFFFAFSGHLAARGIDCPRAVPSRQGWVLGALCDRPAALTTFLHGKDITPLQITATHCASLGQVTARMHNAVAGFSGQRRNTLSLDGWKILAGKTADRADDVSPGLAAFIADEISFLESRWPQEDSLPRGAVHADLFPDNIFFNGTTVSGVIDFYFSCTDFLAYDLAIVLNAWCFDTHHDIDLLRWRTLMEAHTDTRPLNVAEKGAFNVLCRGAALRFLLTRLHDWVFHPAGALVTPKDPLEYLHKLRWHQDNHEAC